MRSDPEFDALLRQLLHSGVAPKYVARLTAELQDHYQDLEHEARRAGVPQNLVAADARERLGRCSAIADEFEKHPELLSWIYSAEWLTGLLRAVAGGYVALCTPIRALAFGPDALMRYTAAGAAGAAVTAILLLSMVVALSPDSRTVHAMTDALRVPIEAMQPRRRADAAPVQASSGSRVTAARERSAGGRPAPGPMPAHQASGSPGAAGHAEGLGWEPRPVYHEVLHVDVPIPELRPNPQTHAVLAFNFDDIRVARLPIVADADSADAAMPKPIVGALPDYPRVAARMGLEGYVIVEYTVSRRGAAEDIVVVESSHELFNRAALHAAQEFRFTPRLIGGEPVDVHAVRTTVRFMLER